MYKKNIFLLYFSLLIAYSFVAEDRSKNFECINTFTYDWKINIKENLNFNETIETLKDVVYLLETSYVDFDEMEKRGFEKDAFIKNGEKLFEKGNLIKTEKVYDYICNSLNPYINDSHFTIWINNNHRQFSQAKLIYLSNTFIKKTKKGYKVIKSDKIPIGTKLELKEENVFRTILNGKEVYRLGILSSDGKYGNFTNLSVFVNNEKINLRCIYTPELFNTNEFKTIETKNSAYVSIPSFDIGAEHFTQFTNLSIKFKKKENIIIDLRQNTGGFPDYYYTFLYYLYSEKLDQEDAKNFENILICRKTKEIVSPIILQQLNHYYEYQKQNGINKNYAEIEKLSKYTGIFYKNEEENETFAKKDNLTSKIIFLTSKTSASASEWMINDSKKLFSNVITVGTNTNGCCKFGNAELYKLKNTGMVVQCCQKQWFQFDENLEEGVGFMPDYIVNDNLEDTITFLTKDKKLAKEIIKISTNDLLQKKNE